MGASRRSMAVGLAVVVLTATASVGCAAPAGSSEGIPPAEPEAVVDPEHYSFPAEWEPHDAVWVAWVGEGLGGRSSERKVTMNAMTVEMVRVLRDHVDVEVFVESEDAAVEAEERLRAEGAWDSRVSLHVHELPYFWMRDPGPLFVRNSAGDTKVVDFRWTSYGRASQTDDDEDSERARRRRLTGDTDRYVADMLGLEVISTDMVSEGGGMTVNGRGTLMVTRWTTLQRNPDHSLEEIETEYLRVMGQRKIVWVPEPLVEDLWLPGPIAANYTGGGANGHLDEYARFVGSSTILLAEVPEAERHDNPVNELNYDVLENNLLALRQQTDQDGNPFEIIRIALPEVDPLRREYTLTEEHYERGKSEFDAAGLKPGDTMYQVAAASYLNYLVTNGLVLIPKYWQEGMPESQRQKDERAREIFAELFPDREIVQLHTLGINYYGGGMHCASQQQPAS